MLSGWHCATVNCNSITTFILLGLKGKYEEDSNVINLNASGDIFHCVGTDGTATNAVKDVLYPDDIELQEGST